MSKQIECQQCGSSDYRLENGFYFCAECHMQSQDVREQLLEQMYSAGANLHKVIGWNPSSSKVGTSTANQSEVEKEESKALSSWECYNYILKGLVDELIQLGAPKSLKTIALQLWVAYLSKIEVAFTSTTLSKKPKLGVYHRESDAALFYKGCKSLRYHVQKARRASMASSRSSNSGSQSAIAKKRRLGSGKRRLARAEYNESLGGSSFDTTSLCSSSMTSFTSGEDERIHHSKAAISELKALDTSGPIVGPSEYYRKFMLKPYCLTLTVVLGILRIALLLCRSDIQIGETMRWTSGGHLSVLNVKRFLPAGAACPSIIKKRHCSMVKIIASSAQLAKYLNILPDEIPTASNIQRLVKRYCKLLHFPDCVEDGVKALLKMKPPKRNFDAYVDHEGQAMAMILFALKLLIGLDDFTEYNYVPRDNDTGIVWEKWCCQFLNQTSKNNPEHYTTLLRLYPERFSFLESGPSQTNPEAYGKLKKRDINIAVLRSSMKAVLLKYVTKAPEAEEKLHPESCPNDSTRLRNLAVLGARTGPQKLKKHVELVSKFDVGFNYEQKIKKKKVVRLLSDDDETSTSGIGSSRSPKREAKRKKNLPFLGSSDFWIYHNRDISSTRQRYCSISQFDIMAAEVLPTSFYWLLCELANTINQVPSRIYYELMIIEKVFFGLKTLHTRW